MKRNSWLYAAALATAVYLAGAWWVSHRMNAARDRYDVQIQQRIARLMPAVAAGDAATLIDNITPEQLPDDLSAIRARVSRWKDLGGLDSYEIADATFAYSSEWRYPYQGVYNVTSRFKAGDLNTQWVFVASDDGTLRLWDVEVGRDADQQD